MNTSILHGVIDRYEGEFAVIELDTGKILNVPKFLLDTEIHSGDAVICMPTPNTGYQVKTNPIWKLDTEETQKRREQIQNLARNIIEPKKKKGKE